MMDDEVVAESSQVESNNILTGFLEKGMLHIPAFLGNGLFLRLLLLENGVCDLVKSREKL